MRLRCVDIVGINTLFVGGKILSSTLKSSDREIEVLELVPELGMIRVAYSSGQQRLIPREICIVEPEVEPVMAQPQRRRRRNAA